VHACVRAWLTFSISKTTMFRRLSPMCETTTAVMSNNIQAARLAGRGRRKCDT